MDGKFNFDAFRRDDGSIDLVTLLGDIDSADAEVNSEDYLRYRQEFDRAAFTLRGIEAIQPISSRQVATSLVVLITALNGLNRGLQQRLSAIEGAMGSVLALADDKLNDLNKRVTALESTGQLENYGA